MTKINRRECLIGMGAVVGSSALSACKRGSEVERSAEVARSAGPAISALTTSVAPQLWNPAWHSASLPAAPDTEIVKLIFFGLSGFSSRKIQGNVYGCDVGFHDRGSKSHHHHLYVRAYSGESGTEVYGNTDFETVDSLAITVPEPTENPNLPNGVYFFQPDPANPLQRSDLTNENDFRWIIDFESDYMYRRYGHKSLPKNENVYHPSFTIPNGLFYTLGRTRNAFYVSAENNPEKIQLGKVANWLAANIYVKPKSSVVLQVDRRPYSVQAPGEIYFLNGCFKSEDHREHCDSEPKDPNKEKRNDFFLNYKAFKRAPSPELELHIEGDPLPPIGSTMGLTHFKQATEVLPPQKSTKHTKGAVTILINDESPCAGAGYSGGGPGLPPSPPS